MARPISDDIFRLARALSHGEYQTLMDDAVKSLHSNVPKGERPLYFRLIEYLREQESYDDERAKAQLGFSEDEQVRWRSLKRDAIKAMERAIDRAIVKQTPDLVLFQIPPRVENLMNKGLWKMADNTIDKYLQVATEHEQHELALRMIKLKYALVQARYPVPKAKEILTQLRETREEIKGKLENVEHFQRLWDLATMEAKENSREEVLSAIVSDELVHKKIILSREAETLYLKTLKRCYFLLKNTEEYREILDQGIAFFAQQEGLEARLEQVTWMMALAWYWAGANKFGKLRECRNDLHSISLSTPELSPAIEGHQIRLLQFEARARLETGTIQGAITAMEGQYEKVSPVIEKSVAVKIMTRHADLLFLLKRFSDSAKWLNRIRNENDEGLPKSHLCFAWVFYLVVRFEMLEFDLINREMQPTLKFLTENCTDPELYDLVLKYIDLGSKVRIANQKGKLAAISTAILDVYNRDPLPKSANFFPFDLWLMSKKTGENFFDLVKRNNEVFDTL